MPKYYITTYALTQGIRHVDVDLDHWDQSFVHERIGGYCRATYKIGTDAFTSRDEAIANAEARRLKKIASLKKQIAKLEAMTFDPPPEAASDE